MGAKLVKLQSSDGMVFVIDKSVALYLEALKKDSIEDSANKNEIIQLSNVSSEVLLQVIEYCKYHEANEKTENCDVNLPTVAVIQTSNSIASENNEKTWDANFIKSNQKMLIDSTWQQIHYKLKA